MDELIVGGGVLGQKVEGTRRQLDAIPLASSIYHLEYISDEVYSHCPMTGQPDFYTAKIELRDPEFGIESKSLKLYLQSFEDPSDAQFCEAFAHTIATAVVEVTKAYAVTVSLKQKPRGGISITATSTITREGS